jgi:uncharacterized membrane protein YczE
MERASFAARLLLVVGGLFPYGVGIALTRQAGLGLGSWHVLNDGLTHVIPLSFGVANILVGLTLLSSAWLCGIRPALGTLLNATLVGTYTDLILATGVVPDLRAAGWSPLMVASRLGLLASGILLIGLSTALYIKGGLGAGPRDGLMLALSRRLERPVEVVRTGMEVTALFLGVLLGGAAGLGTLLFALSIGPVVGYWFRALAVWQPAIAIAAAPTPEAP